MDQQIVSDIAILLSGKCKSEAEKSSFNGRYLKVILDATAIKVLTDAGVNYDEDDNHIDLSMPFNGSLHVFYDVEDFRKRFKGSLQFHDSEILIIKHDSDYLLHLAGESADSIIVNYNAYKVLLDFFLEATDFISYKNDSGRELVIISEKGPLQIGYDPLDVRTLILDSLPSTLLRLKESFSNLEYQGFFKDAIIETISRYPKQDRFYQLALGLSILLDVAERDYQLYFRKFAFDKIKSRFKEERVKYFESIEKNVDNINKQVTAFPLTFSASAFASYQVKDKPYILLLILVVYCLYTLIAWRIINLSKSNMNNVYNDMLSEAKSIIKVYDVIYQEFKPDFKKILNRIKHVNSLICILQTSFLIMLILFIIFVFIQILWVTPLNEPSKFRFI